MPVWGTCLTSIELKDKGSAIIRDGSAELLAYPHEQAYKKAGGFKTSSI